jgi:hypothetical protein
MKRLEEFEVLVIDHRGGRRPGSSLCYTLRMDKLDRLDLPRPNMSKISHLPWGRTATGLCKRRHLAALVIFSIAHRFIDLRHVGVSVDRVSHEDTSAKQG